MTSHCLLPIFFSAPFPYPSQALRAATGGFSVTSSSCLPRSFLVENYDFLLLVSFLIKWDEINLGSPVSLTMPTSPADCLAAKSYLEYLGGQGVSFPINPLTVPSPRSPPAPSHPSCLRPGSLVWPKEQRSHIVRKI